MFVLLMLRSGGTHILDLTTHSGKYWSICGYSFNKTQRLNTLAADNTFPGICPDCKFMYDDMYQSDLDEEPTLARNSTPAKHDKYLAYHKSNQKGPKAKYSRIAIHNWDKLVRYQRQAKRTKKHV